MTDHDVKKMNRKELLELLIASEEENARLRDRLEQQEALLQSRDIQIKNVGSLAEAALVLNGVFESADKAAAQYLENMKRCSEQQEGLYNKIVADAEQKAKAILDNAETVRRQKIDEAEAYWRNLSAKLEAFYQSHVGLRERLLAQSNEKTSENR